MKIDLHCHTQSVKDGDAETRNVSSKLFAQKVSDSDVKILAITNHNHFDLTQYNELSNLVNNYCQVWPGIELDIKNGNKNRWHLIIISNPKMVNEFDRLMKQLLDDYDVNTVTFTTKEVVNAVKELDILYIPHYHKKPGISEDEMVELINLVKEDYRIFQETADFRTLGVFANYQHRVIIGSDVQDWSNYETSTFADLRLPVESFEQFILLAKRDRVIVETLLSKRNMYHVTVSPHVSTHFDLTIFQEMNIIFGQKGTGKSEILSSIYNELKRKGLNCIIYRGNEKESDFDKLLSTAKMPRNMSALGYDNCEQELCDILGWTDVSPTLFSNYLDWYRTQEKNNNKRRMKITNAKALPLKSDSDFNTAQCDLVAVNSILEQLGKLQLGKYFTSEEQTQLNNLIQKLLRTVKAKSIREYIDLESIKLANFSVEKIKQIADKNTDTKSIPSTTGFREYAQTRFDLKKKLLFILKSFNLPPINAINEIGFLEDKGKIYITATTRMLCNGAVTKEFKIGINALKDVKRKIEELENFVFSADISSKVASLATSCDENNIHNLDAFIGTSKVVTTENGELYSPSNGEKGILLLQQKLSTNGDAYFIDEPELGMGNSYIDTCIRPQLSNLARQHKIIVVVTHNANIAVRTLPYQSIFRQHKDGIYSTYIGNPFTNKLVNINDPNDTLIWKNESMHTLEGGEEAFYEREHIYEAGSHQC